MALAPQIVETQRTHGPEIRSTDWRTALPILSAGAVTLREPRMSDAASLIDLLTTEKVSRFISALPTTVSEFERFIASTQHERAAGRSFCFAVVPNGSTTAVGLIRVRAIDHGAGVAEWDFALGSEFWGTGAFIDAAPAVVQFAFETVGITRLEARTCVVNGRGNGALEKLGAVREAILRRSFRRQGEYFDQALWSILRQDWRQSKALFGRAIVH